MFTLGRKVDIHYPTNRMILIISIIVVIIGSIVRKSISSGIYIGVGVFLTWALAREVDPIHEYSAFLCAAFSLLNLFYYEKIQLLVIVWLLLLIRIVNRVTGESLTALDIFSVLGLTIFLSINSENSIYLLLFIVAMAFSIRFKEKTNLSLIAGAISLGLFLVGSFFLDYLFLNKMDFPKIINIIMIASLIVFFVFSNFIAEGKIVDDQGNAVEKSKIIAGQVLYGVTIILLLLFGNISINNLIIYFSVIVGVVLYLIASKLFGSNSSTQN